VSRIAGIFSPWPNFKATTLIKKLLEHFSYCAPQVRVEVGRGVVLGAASVAGSADLVVSRGPFTVAVDATIFDTDDFRADSRSPAEVFLELHERYGFRKALSRINGDFAVALHDATTDTIWLGRDRVGVRPLYFTEGHDFFAWASQPGALLRLPGVSGKVNRRFAGLFAGSHYRTFDNEPDESPFEDIRQLPAGHIAEIRADTGPQLSAYWKLEERPDFDLPEYELAEQYRDLLLDAVRIRLVDSASPAFLLSGGMDSSTVIASAVRVTGKKQHALSSVYEDRTYDESDEIRSMFESSVESWHPVRIGNPDIFSTIDRMVRAHDEPVATATWLSHYLLCERASKMGFGTLFGGLGGDELNAGEYEHFFFRFADLHQEGDINSLSNEVARWIKHHDHPIHRKNIVVVNSALRSVVDPQSPGLCLPDRKRIDRYADAVNRDFFDIRQFAPIMDQPFKSYLKNRTYQDLFRETVPCSLRAEDRNTYAFGLRHVDPFFDYRLLEFMFRIPGKLKINNGLTKVLLRKAMQGILPDETRTRIKKTGWNAPAHVWFSGKSLDSVEDLIHSQAFRERGIYNLPEVIKIVKEHRTIVSENLLKENHMMFVWQLVNLELWYRKVARST